MEASTMRQRPGSRMLVLLVVLSGLLAAAVAAAQDEIYVPTGDAVSVYDRTANGSAAPLRTLGASTFLNLPTAVAVDLLHNELFVVNFGNSTVSVYGRTADGDTAPFRILGGPATGLSFPVAIALDLANHEMYVLNDGNT